MKSNRCEVTATELDDAGLGVGPSAAPARRIHVADLLPGESAEVMIDHHSPHKSEAWGHIVRRIGGSSDLRVEPACPSFGRCGGCTWQHLAYPAQLIAKQRRVERAIEEALGSSAAVVARVVPSPSTVGYRNKGKYVVGYAADRLVLGAYAPRTHEVIDTLGCRIVAPVIDEVAIWVRGAAERAGLTSYDEKTRMGELRYVVLREAAGDVLVVLVVVPGTNRDKLATVAQALSRHAGVRGVVVYENDRRDGAIIPSGSTATVLLGSGHLVEQIAGVDVEVGGGEFLQVNRAQATAMYRRVAELASPGPGTRAVDLFAGLGGIGLHLARAGAEVVAVEIDREAVAQLRQASERAGLKLTAVAADASELPVALRAQLGTQPDVVVVNPPRKGLSAGVRGLLVDLAAPMILYVSCGPEALGRDLAELARLGWHADVIEPFDLMPGTAQVETVVRLRRQA